MGKIRQGMILFIGYLILLSPINAMQPQVVTQISMVNNETKFKNDVIVTAFIGFFALAAYGITYKITSNIRTARKSALVCLTIGALDYVFDWYYNKVIKKIITIKDAEIENMRLKHQKDEEALSDQREDAILCLGCMSLYLADKLKKTETLRKFIDGTQPAIVVQMNSVDVDSGSMCGKAILKLIQFELLDD
jgi:hypothetical protein